MSKFNWRSIDIRLTAVIASLVSSILLRAFPSSMNDDAYLYLHTAEIFLEQGLQAAISHYSWPLFSILIAFTSKLGFSLVSSAFLLNGLFFAILTFSFVSIVQVIDAKRKTLIIAAITILVFPELNDYRSMIIRDMGFWSLSLLSTWQLLLFSRTRQLGSGIGFSLSLILAAGFRMEALAYLFLVPLLLLIGQTEQQAKIAFLKLTATNVAMLFGVFVLLIAADVSPIEQIVQFASTYKPFLDNLLSFSFDHSSTLAIAIFGEFAATYSQEYLWLFMLSGLLSLLLVSLITGIGPPILVFAAAWKLNVRPLIDRQSLITLLVYMGINLLIVGIFVFLTRFLPSRYTMLFSLMSLVLIVLIISKMFDAVELKKLTPLQYALAFLLLYCSVGSYYSFGERKTYLQDSITWLSEQDLDNSILLTNNHAVAYHSGRVQQYDQIARNLSEDKILSAAEGSWVVIELNREMELLMKKLISNKQVELIRGFPEAEPPKIAFYRLTQN